MSACVESQYFSGQGALLVAKRDAAGNHLGFRPVGNVSALSLAVEVTEFEHKESCSGARGIDLVITQEINPTLTFTLESLSKENLEMVLFGTSSDVAAASTTAEPIVGYSGLWSPLPHVNVSNVVVNGTGGTPTHVEGTDYEVNLVSGAIKVIDGGGITDASALEVDYDYVDQELVQALTSGRGEDLVARFEGLNTADGNKPVVVDVFKISNQPLAELALINDEIASMEVEAKVLVDATKPTGEQYFSVKKV